jgi:hypothetical protein
VTPRKTTPPHRGYDPVRLDRRAQANDLEHEVIGLYVAAAKADSEREAERFERIANRLADRVRALRSDVPDDPPTRPSGMLILPSAHPPEPLELEWEDAS